MDNLSQCRQSFQIPGGNYGFTGMQIGDPNMAMEQTLYSLVVDESGSTIGFRSDMARAIQEIIKSLSHSPRADNLMYRHVQFSSSVKEFHGFKPLKQCNIGDYSNVFGSAGSTVLYDAVIESAKATQIYAENLAKERYLANAINVVITDGCDYGSTQGMNDVKKVFDKMVQDECLESLLTILIGVNIKEPHVKQELDAFHQKVGFTQFIAVEDASEKTLAKLADFISKSVSSQSQALGSGGASQSLTF